MNPKTVAVLATGVGQEGGIQRYGTMVLDSLSREGHSFLLRQSIEWGSAASRVRGMAGFLRALDENVDLLWILHPRLALPGLIGARRKGLPVIVSTYGFENWGNYSLASRFALAHADVVTAISVFSSSLMGEPGRKAILLRPTWGMQPRVEDLDHERSGRRSVLFVGRLNESYKGTDVVLDLASRFQADRRWTFVLAGDGLLPIQLQTRAEELPNVRVVCSPSDEELAELYTEAAVLVAPSRAHRLPRNRWVGGEGFGIVLLEAAVAGVPVLASDEGACPETVALLGHGFVSRPTADAFEPVLRDLLDNVDLRNDLGRRGMEFAQYLSPESFQAGVASILEVACGGASYMACKSSERRLPDGSREERL